MKTHAFWNLFGYYKQKENLDKIRKISLQTLIRPTTYNYYIERLKKSSYAFNQKKIKSDENRLKYAKSKNR